MKVIGITGGVGAGKSTVLEYLETRWGVYVIQADQIGHQVMEPGERCYEQILALFDGRVKRADGSLDRGKISEIVFRDAPMLEKLNGIVHPAVKTEILDRLEEQKRQKRSLCAVESALLLEVHYERFCSAVWYIHADEEIRIARLMESRGYTREKALGIIKNQAPEEFFRSRADYIIENNGDWETLRARIDEGVGAV